MLKKSAALIAMCLLFATAALAEQPGRGKGKQGRGEDGGASISIRIDASDRAIVQEYFGNEVRSGRCPPGLAKKNNGCLPPGQAKKWAMGRRLPGDVIYHSLPSDLSVRLNVPVGSKLVRVGMDVLLIAVGTGMVLDAIEDLTRL